MKHLLLRWLLLALLALPPALPALANNTTSPSTGVTSLPSDIPVRREAPPTDTASGRTVFVIWSLLALGALLWVSVRWSRRRQAQHRLIDTALPGDWKQGVAQLFGRSTSTDLRVLSTVRINARHSLHIVAWQHKEYLIGSSEQGLTVLDQRQQPDNTPSGSAAQ